LQVGDIDNPLFCTVGEAEEAGAAAVIASSDKAECTFSALIPGRDIFKRLGAGLGA